MTHFAVTWTIDIEDANTHEEAARSALRIQRDSGSIATVFEVADCTRGRNKDFKRIDLADLPHSPDLARADRLLTAEELDAKYNRNGNGEHPRYLRCDWRHEVSENNTLRGYWQWVEAQLEQDEG